MFEMSKLNVDKFVHSFVRNLAAGIDSSACRKFNKITFTTHLHGACRIKQVLLYSIEKMKEINMQQDLDFSDEKAVKYFMERHSGLFDKLVYLNSMRISTDHLKNINTKILQKIRIKKKHNEGTKKGQIKAHSKNMICCKKLRANFLNKLGASRKNSLSFMGGKERYVNSHMSKKSKFKKDAEALLGCCKDSNVIEVDKEERHKRFARENLVSHVISTAKKEIEAAEKFLWLCTKDAERVKRNIQVTLHIAKNSKYNVDAGDRLKYNEILCRHAILCSITPSSKAVVLAQDDLPMVIEKYLSHGYEYHFESQRASKGSYVGLLVLSEWAKVLVKHTDTTMMRAICGILGCDVEKILVLCN